MGVGMCVVKNGRRRSEAFEEKEFEQLPFMVSSCPALIVPSSTGKRQSNFWIRESFKKCYKSSTGRQVGKGFEC